jgi:uncharacterized membrane protein
MSNIESRKGSAMPDTISIGHLVVLVLLLAFFLRVRTLDFRSLWFDEAIEYWVSTAPFAEIHETVSTLTHDPPLYSYLLRVWKMIGRQAFWLRLPSLFSSMIGLSALMRLGYVSLGRVGALFVGLLVAWSAADVRYAQEVGQYAPMTALLSLNLLFLFALRRRSSLRIWILWGVTAVLSIYMHYGAVVIIAATSLIWLLRSWLARDWKALKQQLIVGGCAILLLLPLPAFIVPAQMGRFSSLSTPIVPVAVTEFFRRSNEILLFHFMGNQRPDELWPAIPAVILTLPLLLVLLVAFWKEHSLTDWPVLLAAAWISYFLLGLNALFFFAGTRHALLLEPLLMLTVGAGIVVLWQWHKAAGLLILLYLVGLSLLTPLEAQEDLRAVTDFWADERDGAQLTYVYYGAVPAFRYYLSLEEDNPVWGQVPADWYAHCWAVESAPYCTQDGVTFGRWMRELDAPAKATRLFEALGRRPDQFWLIFSHTSEREMAGLLGVIGVDYQIVAERRASHAAAFLLEQRP